MVYSLHIFRKEKKIKNYVFSSTRRYVYFCWTIRTFYHILVFHSPRVSYLTKSNFWFSVIEFCAGKGILLSCGLAVGKRKQYAKDNFSVML